MRGLLGLSAHKEQANAIHIASYLVKRSSAETGTDSPDFSAKQRNSNTNMKERNRKYNRLHKIENKASICGDRRRPEVSPAIALSSGELAKATKATTHRRNISLHVLLSLFATRPASPRQRRTRSPG
ncbi:unnamed protein product [Pleuronectes platessa]|uniref:Uncharacterized protein n=1 Tax=Pleuronectes platessa TaxID=8262 RepID=A0A9N7VPX3_PLEPL|nr:unnamed protein product [Pleuronectes platessa]